MDSTIPRLNIGLFYENDPAWIGGTYYVLNLVQALKRLPAMSQPQITVLSARRADYEQLQALTQYPALAFADIGAEPPKWQRAVNKVWRIFSDSNLFEVRPRLDVAFPLRSRRFLHFTALARQRLCWIPDFQEEYLPHLFEAQDLTDRRENHRFVAQQMPHLVLSSEAAAADFRRFYGDIAKCQIHVLPFAVTHDESYKELNISEVRAKYNLPERYYFAPNQFWKHKNHELIIRSMQRLRQSGASDIVMVFSGKEADYRYPHHVEQLKAFVQSEGLSEQVRFLGFIDRQEQLALMNAAWAVVQASRFEGWSTVVEDAKAMNQFLLLSDLAVHREQLPQREQAEFFGVDDEEGLARLLQRCWGETERRAGAVVRDYGDDVQAFGERFMDIVLRVLR